MYIVFRAGRPQSNKKFFTYEEARQAVRKWIRKNKDKKSENYLGFAFWTSNPMIGDFGYSIRKV